MNEFMHLLVWNAPWEMQIWGCWVSSFVVPRAPNLQCGAGTTAGDECHLWQWHSAVWAPCHRRSEMGSHLSDSRVNWREGAGASPHHQAFTGREVANEDLKYLEVLLFRREERREGRAREHADPLWGFTLVFTEEESDLAVIFVKPDKKEYASTHM